MIIPILVATVWFDKPLPWFTLFVAVWGLLATLEFYNVVRSTKATPLVCLGLFWAILLIISRDSDVLAAVRPHFDPGLLAPFILSSAVIVSLIWLVLRWQKNEAFLSWAWTFAGILYIGWLLGYFVALRGMADGRNWVFFTLFATFASDTAAFLVGRTWGRRRLALRISPSKTWEGAAAGVFGAILVSLLFVLRTPLSLTLGWGQAAVLGLFVSLFGQLGDLAESLFKRNMGVKDSGKLLPGHGGVLDRTDSVVFAGVVVYYFALCFYGA